MITKYLIPLIAILAFAGGAFFDAKVLTKKCPDCNPKISCPPQEKCPPCNGIDFDKIKSRQLTIQNQQYITVSGDSLFVEKMVSEFRKELQALKLARCK